jgi:hypothetical protein
VFDVWTLWWSADRLMHGYADLWNALIFHPVVSTNASWRITPLREGSS